jgi:hypothetical protein
MAGKGVLPKYEGRTEFRQPYRLDIEPGWLVGLFLQRIEDGLAERDKYRVCSLARMRKVYGKDFTYPARPGVHQDDAVRQENRLFDIMRHHDDRDIFMLPQPQQLVLQPSARQRVERAQGFI